IGEIGLSEFGVLNITDVFKKSNEQSKHSFKTEQDIIEYNLKALGKVKERISNWFHDVPKAACVIKPYPLHRAKAGAAGEYHPPSEDGSTPGIYYINTFDPENKSRMDNEATLYHELLPG